MSERILTTGEPVPDDNSHMELRADGQQKGYVALNDAERAKGFVKPVRCAYRHAGPAPLPEGLRDLTPDEVENYGHCFAKFQPYPIGHHSRGKFWTQSEIDRAGKICGAVTSMNRILAETYARNPRFYSGTFCVGCAQHFPLNEFAWEPDGEPMDPALQEAWAIGHEARMARDKQERRQRRIAEIGRTLTLLQAELAELREQQ